MKSGRAPTFTLTCLFIATVAAAAPPAGQAPPQTAPRVPPTAQQADVSEIVLARLAELVAERSPDAKPSAKQISAPSGAPGSGTVVDAPSFVQLLGLAVDNDLVGLQNGAITFDLSLFTFRTLQDPWVLIDQQKYATRTNRFLRRVGGAISLGGKGEEFDRDGDGQPEKAETADSLNDIFTTELRLRFLGSRDRRDDQNLATYVGATAPGFDAVVKAVADFQIRHLDDLTTMSTNCNRLGAKDTCLREAILSFLRTPAISAELGPLRAQYEKLSADLETALDKIDRQPVWTAVVGVTRQGEAFGPNRARAGLRGVFGGGRLDHTVNLDWGRAEARRDEHAATSWKAGYSVSTLLPGLAGTDNAIKVAFVVSGERFKNVPNAKHDGILTGGVKFEIPVNSNVTVPISLIYASRSDLLTDAGLVRGHIGLAWDFSGVMKKD